MLSPRRALLLCVGLLCLSPRRVAAQNECASLPIVTGNGPRAAFNQLVPTANGALRDAQGAATQFASFSNGLDAFGIERGSVLR